MSSFNSYQQMHHEALYGKKPQQKAGPKGNEKLYNLVQAGGIVPEAQGKPYAICVYERKKRVAQGVPAYTFKIVPIK